MRISDAQEFLTLLDDYVKKRAEMELDIEFSRQRAWAKKNEELGEFRHRLLEFLIHNDSL